MDEDDEEDAGAAGGAGDDADISAIVLGTYAGKSFKFPIIGCQNASANKTI